MNMNTFLKKYQKLEPHHKIMPFHVTYYGEIARCAYPEMVGRNHGDGIKSVVFYRKNPRVSKKAKNYACSSGCVKKTGKTYTFPRPIKAWAPKKLFDGGNPSRWYTVAFSEARRGLIPVLITPIKSRKNK